MFYKVVKNDKVIDVLDQLIYLKWEPKHKIMVLCSEDEAQAILSSGEDDIWHERTLYKVPVEGFDCVDVLPIDEYEYKKLKMLNLSTPQEIIDSFVLSLLEDKII